MENKYRWLAWGDLNGFLGLMVDNITNLVFLTAILTGVFHFPKEFIFTRMIPGTAFGVPVGDLLYTWMAFRLAAGTKNPNVTAMPLGLDTPSTFCRPGPHLFSQPRSLSHLVCGNGYIILYRFIKNYDHPDCRMG